MSKEKESAEKYVRKLYSDINRNWERYPLKKIVDHFRSEFQRIDEENFSVSQKFLALVFIDPSLTYSFHIASARTIDRFLKATRKGDSFLIEESHFFIDHRPGTGLFSTITVNKPAAYDLPIPKIKTVEDETRITIAHFHTHPPLGDVLAPSVLIETSKGYKGDLYAFSAIRAMNKENVLKGKKPSFVPHQLAIMLQENLTSQQVSILFIRESKKLALLDHPTYIQMLRANAKLFEDVPDTQTVCQYLRQLNFQASCVDLSALEYYSYPFFSPTHLERIAEDLQD